MSALKHGLSSVDGRAVLPTDDPKKYAAHQKRWWASRDPVGLEEEELTGMAADLTWRLRRYPKIEYGMFIIGITDYQERFRTELQRVVDGAVAEVARVAKNELSPEALRSGPVRDALSSLPVRDAAENAQRVIDDVVDVRDSEEARLASGWIQNPDGFTKLSRYETTPLTAWCGSSSGSMRSRRSGGRAGTRRPSRLFPAPGRRRAEIGRLLEAAHAARGSDSSASNTSWTSSRVSESGSAEPEMRSIRASNAGRSRPATRPSAKTRRICGSEAGRVSPRERSRQRAAWSSSTVSGASPAARTSRKSTAVASASPRAWCASRAISCLSQRASRLCAGASGSSNRNASRVHATAGGS